MPPAKLPRVKPCVYPVIIGLLIMVSGVNIFVFWSLHGYMESQLFGARMGMSVRTAKQGTPWWEPAMLGQADGGVSEDDLRIATCPVPSSREVDPRPPISGPPLRGAAVRPECKPIDTCRVINYHKLDPSMGWKAATGRNAERNREDQTALGLVLTNLRLHLAANGTVERATLARSCLAKVD